MNPSTTACAHCENQVKVGSNFCGKCCEVLPTCPSDLAQKRLSDTTWLAYRQRVRDQLAQQAQLRPTLLSLEEQRQKAQSDGDGVGELLFGFLQRVAVKNASLQ